MVVNCPRFLCRHHSPIVLAALALLHLSNLAADAAPDASKARRASASPIYSLSNKQQAIGALGAYGIPAYAMIGRQRCRGTYLSLVRNGTAAYTTGLRSEDVLLSINDRVTESPSVTDKIIAEFSSQPVRVKYARKVGNVLSLRETSATWNIASQTETTPPSGETMSTYGSTVSKPKSFSRGELENYMIQLINNDRTADGAGTVHRSSTLEKMAQAYADDIGKRGFFSHTDPEGRNPQMRAQIFGITRSIGENLAFVTGGADGRDMVKRCQTNMMNEPKDDPTNHRANILNPKHKSVGVGVAPYKGAGVVTVQEFSFEDLP